MVFFKRRFDLKDGEELDFTVGVDGIFRNVLPFVKIAGKVIDLSNPPIFTAKDVISIEGPCVLVCGMEKGTPPEGWGPAAEHELSYRL